MLNFSKDDLFSCIYVGIVHNNYTIRKIAEDLGYSKSYIHKLIHSNDFLFYCVQNNLDYKSVEIVLKFHYNFKYINGGQATKRKYEKLRGRS